MIGRGWYYPLPVKCADCKYWQGTKYDKWADCFRVIAELDSRLLQFGSRQGDKFSVPFDPHDAKYFLHDPGFNKVYRKLSRGKWTDVRLHKVREKDTVFDRDGNFGEKRMITLNYYQTKPTHSCERGECADGI